MERIIRRAVDLAGAGPVPPTTEERLAAVRAAAAELGLDATAVQQAIAEQRVGVLGPVSEPRPGDRWVGVSAVVVHRVVDGSAVAVADRVDRVLRYSHGLRRWEQTGPSTRYGRRSDLGATMQRTARALRGMPLLQVVSQLGVMVSPIDDHTAVVALRVELRGARVAAEALGGGVAVTGAAGSVAAAATWHPAFLAGSAGAMGAGYAVGRTHQRRVDRARRELEALLDEIGAGVDPRDVWQSARDVADRFGVRRVARPWSDLRSGPGGAGRARRPARGNRVA